MRTLQVEQNATQQVGSDISGWIVSGLQQVRQELQSALCVVLIDGTVNQAQALAAQHLWSFKTFFFFFIKQLKKKKKKRK